MKTYVLLLAALSLALFSCKKDNLELTGEPSLIGAVGNELTFSHQIDGIGPVSAVIGAVNDGISTINASFTVNDPDLLAIITEVAGLYPTDLTVVTNIVTTTMNARFTTDGIAWVHKSGEELVVCKYDAKVGDEWTMNVDGKNVKHKVSQKSTEDDYDFLFWRIKVVTMNATGYGLPGLERVEFVSNHKFGPVGIKGYLSNDSTMIATIISTFENE